MVQELTEGERQALAREIAADSCVDRRNYKFRCPECSKLFFDSVATETVRSAFMKGWDAALEHVRQREQELLLKP